MYEVEYPTKGLIAHGVSTCPGCGLELAIRKVLDVLGEDTIIIVPPGCSALFSGFGDQTAFRIPGFQGNLENSAALAAGIRNALNALGNEETTVLAFAGDGATVDIGLQALSGALERNDRILYVCVDNEAYMNTGIQGSSSTPLFASTTTTPAGKNVNRKDLMRIAIAHDIPYAASASIHKINDLQKKVKKASEVEGPSLIHIQIPCPTGWGYEAARTIEIARLAVQTGSWILYEYDDGQITINYKPSSLKPMEEYIKLQSRFKKLSDTQMEELQNSVTKYFEKQINWLEALSK